MYTVNTENLWLRILHIFSRSLYRYTVVVSLFPMTHVILSQDVTLLSIYGLVAYI